MSVASIYETVQADFELVNHLITSQLFSDVPLVEKIGHYIIESGGKRMRPLLVLLTANAVQSTTDSPASQEEKAKLAAIIEFLHTATLLHDDVVDTSDMRRGKQTANARWGNAPSVLVGDFLYSRAFQMMVELNRMPVMSILANATNIIAEGEVLQLMNCKNPNVDEAHYMEVIRCKTAMLFQAASHSAASLMNASTPTLEAMRDFGLKLGLAFQLVDDVLDYSGDAATMGKNVGDDLAEGKPTLPLIYAMREARASDQALIRDAIRKGGLDDLGQIQQAVADCGALDYTMEKARKLSEEATDLLRSLPDSPYKEALTRLARLAVTRNS